MYRHIISLVAFSFITAAAYGQQGAGTDGVIPGQRRTIELERQPWAATNNAAGLSRIVITDNGLAYVGVERSAGAYHRPQQGNAMNTFRFGADRFMKIGKYLRVYGNFEMELGREFDRAWSDVVDTYGGNPYIYGSARKGNYDRQTFDIEAKVSTVEFGRFTFGFGLRYRVGDLSRLKDPRPRNIFADYSLIPSVTFRIGDGHTLGLDGYYRFDKRKLTGISTVEPDKYTYYDFRGMENVILSSTSLFGRAFTAKHWGGDIQYTYNTDRMVWLTGIGWDAMEDAVTGPERSSPGRYAAHTFSALTTLRVNTPAMVHSVTIEGWYVDGNADMYKQTEMSETDDEGNVSKYWETTYSALVYRNYDTKASFSYRAYRTLGTGSYKWYAGVGGEYRSLENSYILPFSVRKVSVADIHVDFGFDALDRNGHNVLIEGKAGMRLPLKSNMELAAVSEVSENVLVPDQAFFDSKNYGFDLRATYSFPLRLGEKLQRGFIKVYGAGVVSDYRNAAGNRTRRGTIGVSLGLLTM